MIYRSLVAAALFSLASCASDGTLLDRVNLNALRCRPFETVVAGVVSVGQVEGKVYAQPALAQHLDASELYGMPGVELVLRLLGGSDVIASTHTDSSGHFRLGALPEGVYQLESCFDGFDSLIFVVKVAPGRRSSPILFGLSPSA